MPHIGAAEPHKDLEDEIVRTPLLNKVTQQVRIARIAKADGPIS